MALHHVWTSLNFQRIVIQPSLLPFLQRARTLVSSTQTAKDDGKGTENKLLLDNLKILGVDVKMARKRQPGVLRKKVTNEHGLVRFLQTKGANRDVVASIISRYPRAITRSGEHLEERWRLWRSVFQSDSEIISILNRSPESFFRSSDNEDLEKNISFLTSLGLNSKDLHRLVTTAPRTFSNSVELNHQMVDLLQDVCVSLGGKEPSQFARAIIAKNVYILIRSTKRVKANVEFLQASLGLKDSDLLSLLQGSGAEILDLSHEILKRNFRILHEKLDSLGCNREATNKLIVNYASILFVSPGRTSDKLDCLLKAGITMKQVMEKPKVLDFSLDNLRWRLDELRKVGYDFDQNGIGILDNSRKRFEAKLQKLDSVEGWQCSVTSLLPFYNVNQLTRPKWNMISDLTQRKEERLNSLEWVNVNRVLPDVGLFKTLSWTANKKFENICVTLLELDVSCQFSFTVAQPSVCMGLQVTQVLNSYVCVSMQVNYLKCHIGNYK